MLKKVTDKVQIYSRWELPWRYLTTFQEFWSWFIVTIYAVIFLSFYSVGLWLLLSKPSHPAGRVLMALGSFFVHLTFVIIPFWLAFQIQCTETEKFFLRIPLLYFTSIVSIMAITSLVLPALLHRPHQFLLVSKYLSLSLYVLIHIRQRISWQ